MRRHGESLQPLVDLARPHLGALHWRLLLAGARVDNAGGLRLFERVDGVLGWALAGLVVQVEGNL